MFSRFEHDPNRTFLFHSQKSIAIIQVLQFHWIRNKTNKYYQDLNTIPTESLGVTVSEISRSQEKKIWQTS